jgi:uncharacterized protein YndB with AHSA1/START domain
MGDGQEVAMKTLVAEATIWIEAPKSAVWDALVTPSAIKQYMFGADVESTWAEGSPITWKGEFQGKNYEDKGIIHTFEPERTLEYSHYSPMSGKPDRPENYHTVTIHLTGGGNRTEVELSQDNNSDEESREESAKNWNTMLQGLKKYVEESYQAPDEV